MGIKANVGFVRFVNVSLWLLLITLIALPIFDKWNVRRQLIEDIHVGDTKQKVEQIWHDNKYKANKSLQTDEIITQIFHIGINQYREIYIKRRVGIITSMVCVCVIDNSEKVSTVICREER